MRKRLIDANHLIDMLMMAYPNHRHVDINDVIKIIGSEPTEERSAMIALIPVLIFILVAIIVYHSL